MCDPEMAFLSEQPDEHLPLPSEASLCKALHRAGKDLQAVRTRQIWEDHAATIHIEHFRKICRAAPVITYPNLEKILDTLRHMQEGSGSLPFGGTTDLLKGFPSEISQFFTEGENNPQLDIKKFWVEYEEILRQSSALNKEQLRLLPPATNSPSKGSKDPFQRALQTFYKLLPSDWFSDSVRGCLFWESPDQLLVNEFQLELEADTEILISVQAVPMSTSTGQINPSMHDVDLDLFLLRHVEDKLHKRLTAFANMATPQKQTYFRQRVPAGTYSLITYTSGTWFDKRKIQEKAFSREKLIGKSGMSKDPSAAELSVQFEEALSNIFEMIDLNGDGVVDREEFGIFALRTTGEEVKDADWNVVTSTFCSGRNYLDKEAFIALHRMEVRDSNEEELNDLWLTLSSMGFNADLSIDKAVPFSLNVGCSDCEPLLSPTHIKPASRIMEKCIVRGAVEGDDFEQLDDGIVLHKFKTPNRCCLVLENKTSQGRTVDSTLLQSVNCLSSEQFPMRLYLPPNSCEIITQFVPHDNTLPWSFNTTEIIE